MMYNLYVVIRYSNKLSLLATTIIDFKYVGPLLQYLITLQIS